MSAKTKWTGLFSLLLVLVLSISAFADDQHKGAWVDEVIMTAEPSASAAIRRLQVGDIDLYSSATTESDVVQTAQSDPNIDYAEQFGLYFELTFNTAAFEDGRLNPFVDRELRSAMNRLIDREYIAQEIFNGLALPKLHMLNSAFPDYARMADVARRLEAEYAYNPEAAREVIFARLEALGAQRVNGLWHYNGQPVTIIVAIRNEDERLALGDYAAGVMEDLGFLTERLYRTSAELSPVVFTADPRAGLFHIYTGAWSATAVTRDQGPNFNQFYTDKVMAGYPLWEALRPNPELVEVADRLATRDFRTIDERSELFARMLELALLESNVIWIADTTSVLPRRAEFTVASDLAAGIAGTPLWALTLRRGEEIGGRVNIAQPQVLVEPWNPLDGSNWVHDMMPVRAIREAGTVNDPYTGLPWPQRIERAEVVIQTGLPVSATLDWVNLSFDDVIEVPADAWINWNPVEQRFITVAEQHPDGLTAARKSVVYYPEDLYEVQWHDGSTISLGDFVFNMILQFDRGMEGSPYYDPAKTPDTQSFLRNFRGVRIVQENPLVIETYSDLWTLDAEVNVNTWFPAWDRGPGPWHMLAIGLLAERNEQAAFTSSKADRLDGEWISYISGPSLAILGTNLAQAQADSYLPYAATLSQYISGNELAQRYSALQSWHAQKGHYFIGSGPMYLEAVHPVEGVVHLRRNPNYPDLASKWALFGEPMIATVDATGPGTVRRGSEAVFQAEVTFGGDAYLIEHMSEVKYLVYDARGQVVLVGEAEAVADGLWQAVLTAEETAELPVGASRIEIIAVPLLVAMPSFDAHTFVTLP